LFRSSAHPRAAAARCAGPLHCRQALVWRQGQANREGAAVQRGRLGDVVRQLAVHLGRSHPPQGEQPQLYLLPLGIAWELAENEARIRALKPWALARVRQRGQVGILYSALGDDQFCRSLIDAIGAGEEFEFGGGRIRFFRTKAYAVLTEGLTEETIRRPALEQSNTSVFFGDRLFLKLYRRLQVGVNPELEMGLFLTEVSPFQHVAPVAGGIEYVAGGGSVMTLGLLQGYVENQGDGWHATKDYLGR